MKHEIHLEMELPAGAPRGWRQWLATWLVGLGWYVAGARNVRARSLP